MFVRWYLVSTKKTSLKSLISFLNFTSTPLFSVRPLESQPQWLQYFSLTLPTTLPTVTVKNIIAKGFGMSHQTIYGGFGLLGIYMATMVFVSYWTLKWTKFTEQH